MRCTWIVRLRSSLSTVRRSAHGPLTGPVGDYGDGKSSPVKDHDRVEAGGSLRYIHSSCLPRIARLFQPHITAFDFQPPTLFIPHSASRLLIFRQARR